MNFSDFDFDPQLMDGIEAMQFNEATPVQEQVIPEILKGRDVIACAQTGTGKTAAFLLPVIHRIITNQEDKDRIRAMVIVPTRELAVQISQQMEGFGYFTPVSSLAIYGGGTGEVYAAEKKALTSGVDLVVCTPGRMISHLNLGYADFSGLEFLILDEADRMLDMGFHDDIMKIISFLPKKRQSLLFSATMPPKIRELSRKILRNPAEINIGLSTPPEQIGQEAYMVYEDQKLPAVKWLVQDDRMRSILIFSDTKSGVKQLTKELKKSQQSVEEIHSDLDQSVREEVMNRFKSRKTRILVATDVISRGIDVEDIDMVINYDVPHDAEDYVHRIGRTARAGAHGKACTLITPAEAGNFAAIEQLLGKPVDKPGLPESLGQTPKYDPAPAGKKRFHKKPFQHKKRRKPRTGKSHRRDRPNKQA